MLKWKKKCGSCYGSCLLNSTANPAQFGWKWAGLALLFSRQHSNNSHDFFHTFSIIFRYETIETQAIAFLTHISLAIHRWCVLWNAKESSNFLIQFINIILSLFLGVGQCSVHIMIWHIFWRIEPKWKTKRVRLFSFVDNYLGLKKAKHEKESFSERWRQHFWQMLNAI